MTAPADQNAADARAGLELCAHASLRLGEDPIGTAPQWGQALVLELPAAEWDRLRDSARWTPEEAATYAALGEAVGAGGQHGTAGGFGLLMSQPMQPREAGRVGARHYTRPVRADGLLPARLERRDSLHSSVAGALALLLPVLRGEAAPSAGDSDSDSAGVLGTAGGLDLHVCTHGTVDASCGRLGYPVWAELSRLNDPLLRPWRTGHFGGHRLAATAVELPAGRSWGRLSAGAAQQLAARTGEAAELAPLLRGDTRFSAWGQVLDREGLRLAAPGLTCWSWLDAAKRETVRPGTGEQAGAARHVTLEFALQDGRRGVLEATVRVRAVLEVPGSTHKPGVSAAPQYRVDALRLTWAGPDGGAA